MNYGGHEIVQLTDKNVQLFWQFGGVQICPLCEAQKMSFQCKIIKENAKISSDQSWKKLHAAHAVREDIFSELRTFWFRNHADILCLQIYVVIFIYFEGNIEE
jgi:hypothetical protein